MQQTTVGRHTVTIVVIMVIMVIIMSWVLMVRGRGQEARAAVRARVGGGASCGRRSVGGS